MPRLIDVIQKYRSAIMTDEIKVTEEMKHELMDTYEGNKEMLYEMEEFLNNNGYLDNGVSDIHETFEMGYNNALQYVFGLLGITELSV